ncbi:EEA1 [Symbiodinium natans]|uniref:EEA1 protein n=1 Tax=Symbiodinium natans TaxID=878477 RepID=A0A812J8F5_9DINO|nr:EEA1 [Symbiodinium natans]
MEVHGASPERSPTASLISSDDGQGAQADAKESACPRCGANFTTYFRRHHCRHCGGLVCDDCSRHRTRIPQDPSLGNVRVCDDCFKVIGDHHAAGLEEDLALSRHLIDQLKDALKQKHNQSEAFKKVMLELEAEAVGNRERLDQHAQDPDSDDFSFKVLQDRVQHCWGDVLTSLEAQGKLKVVLEERQRNGQKHREELISTEEEMSSRYQQLDAELAEVTRMEAKRDELFRLEGELERAVGAERRRVRELELGRQAQQELEAERISQRLGWGSRPLRSTEPVAFTISTGRQEQSQNRLDGCRRSCTVS